MNCRQLVPFATAMVVFAACGKKEGNRPDAPAVSSASRSTPEVAPNDEDSPGLVTPDDLADKANEDINAENLEQQLDGLEREIGTGE